MRIEFLTQADPIYILPLMEEFVKTYSRDFDVVRVSCCPTMGRRSRLKLVRELVELYGLAGFVRLVSRVAVSRVLGLFPRGKGGRRYFSLGQICRAYEIETRNIGNPNSREFLQEVKDRGCDLIVSVACPYILKQDLLNLPPLGCINIHHAPLPRYKGMMPTFWQMFNGERTVGLTIHYMSEKVDEGAALLQETLSFESNETLDSLIRRSKRHAAHSLARVLRLIANDSASTVPLNKDKSSYFTFPTFAEIREFHRRGLRAI